MFGMDQRFWTGAAVAAATLSLTAAGAARAGDGSVFPPNYTFSNGAQGWLLTSHGGPINPGVLVGFNPQPDPPGDGDKGALIGLLNPADPMLMSPSTGGSFTFLIGLLFPGDGSVVPMPDAPNSDGFTGFRHLEGGHDISVNLQFGPQQVDATTWGANGLPGGLPDGNFLGGAFQFSEKLDPWMSFSISIDGSPLTCALDNSGVPEPAGWGLLIAGFGGVGAMLRMRRRRMVALAACRQASAPRPGSATSQCARLRPGVQARAPRRRTMAMRFNSIPAALIAAMLAATGANAAAASQSAKDCFRSNDWEGWSAPGDGDVLYLRIKMHDVYRIDLVPGSHVRKDPGYFLVNRVRGSNWICSPLDLDLTVSDQQGFREPLFPRSIRKLAPAEIAAIPRKDLP